MLVKCKNCGSEVSDKATKCPSCGCELVPKTTNNDISDSNDSNDSSDSEKTVIVSEKPKKKKTGLIIAIIVIAVIIIGIVLFNMGSGSGTWTLSQAFLLESGEEIDASSMDASLEIESDDTGTIRYNNLEYTFNWTSAGEQTLMDITGEGYIGSCSNNDVIIGLYSSIGGQNYWLISIDEYIFLFMK